VRRRKTEQDDRQVQENEKGCRKATGWLRRRKTEQEDRQVQENEKGSKDDDGLGEKKKG
jgi:hypothetical protein